MPRSALPFHRSPCAATYTTSGLRGCTRTALTCRVPASPAFFHVRPWSVLLYTPSPYEDDCPRMACSPVATYSTCSSLGATAMAPMEPVEKKPSEMLRQLIPALSVRHTPPPV